MNLDWIKNFPNTETPINKDFFIKLQNSILDYAFPVGKIEIFYDDEDHSNFMGFTWEKCLSGKTPVGINENDTDFNSIGKTGGEKKHTLTVNEMPDHTHGFARIINATGFGDFYGGAPMTSGGKLDENAHTDYTGGNQAHNNMQPYEIVAFWKRIS